MNQGRNYNIFHRREDISVNLRFMAAPNPNQQAPQQVQLTGEQWFCGQYATNQPNWILNGSGMSVNPLTTITAPTLVRRSFSTFGPAPLFNYRNDKCYQYITNVSNYYSLSNTAPLTITTPWLENMTYNQMNSSSPGNGHLFFYSKPTNTVSSTEIVRYRAPNTFGTNQTPNETINSVLMNEMDWEVQGFGTFRIGTMSSSISTLNPINDSLGWCHYQDTNSWVWFDSGTTASVNGKFPAGGNISKSVASGWRDRNALFRYVGSSKFNLSFTYQKISGDPDDGISIFLSQNKPLSTPGPFSFTGLDFVASLTYSTTATFSAFYGLEGNQFIIIVGGKTGTNNLRIALTDLKIDGGYHPGNNRTYLMTNSLIWQNPTPITVIGLTGATYSAIVGEGNTVNATQSLSLSAIYSKMGNGKFRAGIWENGVWNSGSREDTGVWDFDSVDRYVNYSEDKVWRFSITGPTSSVSNFEIGDKIAIGNIVAIDVNSERKLLKNFFTIIDKIPEDNPVSLIVEFTNNFPLRLVEKDSPLHRIKVTKNVWLSGGFLNGYFKGVWNSGLFKGYPLITEMFDSHWIDGRFEGGHYKNTRLVGSFSSTFLSGVNSLGLSFSSRHNLRVGDTIVIDKTNKNFNTSYDGEATVSAILDDFRIITNKIYGFSPTSSETGSIFTDYTTGVIQNFDFKSQNISKITSAQTTESDAVFKYNSWVDTFYPRTSAVNILKSTTSINPISRRTFSENNLYGWPTYDVLSSNSVFRDSFTLNESNYRLGTKWKKYTDFIGESSQFEDYFGPTGPDASLFIEKGWTYSSSGSFSQTTVLGPTGSSRVLFTRSTDSGETEIVENGNYRKTTGKELIVDASELGGVLDIISSDDLDINGRSTVGIEKSRYSIVEFDLLGWGFRQTTTSSVLNQSNWLTYNSGPSVVYEPVIHFDNVNYSRRSVANIGGITYSNLIVANTYLPVNQNVNHLETPKTTKIEYFFNKRNLSMTFRGNGQYSGNPNVLQTSTVTSIIDNLKFYEVDMIPFFKYFDDSSINRGIEIPFQGIAPFIDYSNENFSFIDNISLGLDSIETTNSNVVVSGVGIGINLTPTNPFFNEETQVISQQNLFISDQRVKDNVTLAGKSPKGINIYHFNFLNKPGRWSGVIAQELLGTEFEKALTIIDGLYHVNYSAIDVRFRRV